MTAMTMRSESEHPRHSGNPDGVDEARVVLPLLDDERTRLRRRVVTPEPVRCHDSSGPSLGGSSLTRRGKMVVAAVWVVLVVAGVLAFVRPAPAPQSPSETQAVRVEAGDTLWQLAGEIAPEADLRDVVAEIVEINGLASGADIRPGDVLLVPVSR